MAAGATQRHRLALLALLAARGERGRSREQVLALLWPERDTTHARQLLNQAVYSLRKALGEGALHSAGDDLRLNSAVVRADAAEFEAALKRGSHDAAVALYRGPFLDGFVLPEAPEFERWAALERDRLAAGYARALEALAEGAEARRDAGSAVRWWRARAAHDPYDSRVAIRLMRALEADGNVGGALQHAGIHAALLQAELGVQPTPEVSALAERLRRAAAVHPPVGSSGAPDDARRAASQPSRPLAHGEAAPAAERSGPPDHAVGGELEPTTASVMAPATATPRSTARSSAPASATTPRAPRHLGRPGRYTAALAVCAAVVAFWLGLTRRGQEASEAQHELARVVGRELDLRLGSPGRTPLGRPPTQSVAAYDLYRRGSDPARLRSDSAAREGVELLRQAVALDSAYAPAWAALALMHHRVGLLLPPGIRERHHLLAQEAARKAVVLDDSLAEAQGALGMVRMVAFDFAAAERHLTRAETLDPTFAEPHESMVTLYLWTTLGYPAPTRVPPWSSASSLRSPARRRRRSATTNASGYSLSPPGRAAAGIAATAPTTWSGSASSGAPANSGSRSRRSGTSWGSPTSRTGPAPRSISWPGRTWRRSTRSWPASPRCGTSSNASSASAAAGSPSPTAGSSVRLGSQAPRCRRRPSRSRGRPLTLESAPGCIVRP